jgi:hypothetical protein
MQPNFGSQIGFSAEHSPLSGWYEQTPPLQVSLVQASPSLQSVSTQQALQPSPTQHLVPMAQGSKAQLPFTHAPFV